MGNRATIAVPTAKHMIYLQWNGGLGSVRAFTDEALRRNGGQINESLIYELYGAIRDFFSFAGEKNRGRDGLSLYIVDKASKCEGDNGHYSITPKGKLDTSEARLIEDFVYTAKSYNNITGFFQKMESMQLKADWDAA